MGHRSWMGDQRFGTTQTHRQLHDLKIIEQRKSLLLAALDVEGKGRTGRGTLPIEYKLARIELSADGAAPAHDLSHEASGAADAAADEIAVAADIFGERAQRDVGAAF